MMGLYTVVVEKQLELVVVADSEWEAKEAALEAVADGAAEDHGVDWETAYCIPVKSADDVPFGWDDAIPYGGENDQTVDQLLAKQNSAEQPK